MPSRTHILADSEGDEVLTLDNVQVLDPRRRTVPEKRVFRIVSALAFVAVVAALVLNLVRVPGISTIEGATTGVSRNGISRPYRPPTVPVSLQQSPKSMLPGEIIGYETVAVQAVPGQNGTAAEAIYKTSDMRVESQISLGSYTRVEGFATPDVALSHAADLMKLYTASRETTMMNGVTPAQVGYTRDRSMWAATWTKGQYVFFIKSFFQDHPIEDIHHFLDVQGVQIAAAVEVYARTGKQGVQAQSLIKAPLPETTGAQSGLGKAKLLNGP